jgi:hypothetical protein
MDFTIDRETRDLLNAVLDLLWLSPLELLMLLVPRARLLPHILDLSSFDTFDWLVDWMFSFSNLCIGDFLIDFKRSFPYSFTSNRPL